MWLDSLLSILERLIPGRMERYINELDSLIAEYHKALKDGRDTDAAKTRKRITLLRRKLKYADDTV